MDEKHGKNLGSESSSTRRQFLTKTGALGGLLAAAPLVSPSSVSRLKGFASPSERAHAVKNIDVVWTNVALPPNIDPAVGYDSDTLQFVRNVYEGLLEYVPGGTAVRPALAESYSASPNGLTWTFQLRKGVVFHDGSALTAEVAVKSLSRIQEINQGPASLMSSVKSFQAKGPLTVIVHMHSPYVFLPGVMPWLPIVSAKALAAHVTSTDPHAEKYFASHAVGTGPYQLKNFNPESRIDLVRNPHYWQAWHVGTPTAGSMTLNANVTTQLELLQAGQVDFLGAISPDNAVTARTLSNVVLLTQPALEIQIMPLNMMRAPMDNPLVRQAMVEAFDYQAFLTFNKGFGKPANSPVAPGLPGWDSTIPYPKQNLTNAKSLLAQAGVTPGTALDFVGVEGLDYESFAAVTLQSALTSLGLTLNITAPAWPEPATIMSNPTTGAHISFLNLSANTNDPSASIREAWASSQIASKGGYNWSYYQNPVIDSSLSKFGSVSSAAAQKAIITGMQRTIVGDNTAIFALAPELTEPVGRKWRNSKYDALFDSNVVRWFYTKSAS